MANLNPDINQSSLENIANYLGENVSSVDAGLQTSIKAFLGIITKFVENKNGASSLASVLEQGGHTGDVVQNLASFTSKNEKLQLLLKIGANIVEHFFNGKTNTIVDSLSSGSGIRKTSANSLLSLSAPIVLGHLGKLKTENNFSPDALANLLIDNKNTLIAQLSPSIITVLDLKTNTSSVVQQPNIVSTQSTIEKKVEEKKNKISKPFPWATVIPWVLLAAAGTYTLLSKTDLIQKTFPALAIKSDSTKVVSNSDSIPADFLPVTSKPEETKNETKIEAKIEPKEDQKKVIETKNIEKPVQPSKADNSNPKLTFTENKSESKAFKEPKKSEETSNVSESSSSLPAGYSNISSSVFKRNSAEISGGSELSSIINKAGSNNIVIYPTSSSNLAEDRAYAVREYLIEKGLSSSQVSVGSKIKGGSSSLVAYKLK